MSNALTGFALKRTRTQALGFYIVWLIGGTVLTTTLLYIYMCLGGNGPMPEGMDVVATMRAFEAVRVTVGSFIICVFSLVLAALIISAKRLYNRSALICVLLAALFSLSGLIPSLIPVAYLTTLPKKGS